MNPLYAMLTGQQSVSQQSASPTAPQVPQFTNPVQKANYIMQAMTNPAAFVRQAIPNLPPQIANDPNQILQWMLQNGMATPQDIQNAANSIPRF